VGVFAGACGDADEHPAHQHPAARRTMRRRMGSFIPSAMGRW
jgi:hypothetical protein